MNLKYERDVVGYEGLYTVTNRGDIISQPKSTSKRVFVIKHTVNNSGYRCVSLCKSGKHHSMTIHKIVMEAFVGSRKDGNDIDHIDGNKQNNELSNLRYVTRKTNMENARHNGFVNYGVKSHFSKLTESLVRKIQKDTRILTLVAEQYGISIATVSRIRNNKTWVRTLEVPAIKEAE